MAIQLVSAIKRYIGTAAEVAAFPLAGLPVGSTFFESDTGILKVLNAAGALVQAPGETVALSGSSIPDTEPVPVNMVTSLDSDYDSVNVDKMGKGAVTTAHAAIAATATSAEIDCRGYNAIMLEIVQSAAEAWTYTVQGCMVSGGTFVDVYEMANTGALALMTVVGNTLNRILVFKGIPDYIKIVATEVAGTATVTVKVQPCNL